jgi:hypothetical protein
VSKKRPLMVKIEHGEVVIRIGVDVLAFAAEKGPVFDMEDPPQIIDKNEWARDVVTELEREEEDGTTPIHAMLDAAMRAAVEGGSLAVVWPDEIDDEDGDSDPMDGARKTNASGERL